MTVQEILAQAEKIQPKDSLFHEGYEGYFDQHKQRTKPTDGDYSLAPQLENREFVENLKYRPAKSDEIKQTLHQKYSVLFDQWSLELIEGYSICFYGVGSKLELVHEFLDHWSSPWPTVVVNGYLPLDFKEILNYCVDICVPESISNDWLRSPNERITLFHQYLQKNLNVQIVLCIHAIDSISLRDDRSRELLCRLVSAPNIRFLATVEHTKAPVLWNTHQLSQLRLLWHHISTFDPLIIEHSYQDVAAFGKSGAKSSKSVDTILASLTSNAQKLFRLLVRMQYELMKSQKVEQSSLAKLSNGIRMNELYEQCLDDFIVSSESTLQRLLNEFSSHDIIKLGFNRDGQELVYVKGSFSEIRNYLHA